MTNWPTLLHVPRRLESVETVVLALVHSNLFIAVGATSWVVTTAVLLDLPIDPLALVIVFTATLFVYSLNRITDIEEDTRNVPGRAAFTRRYGRYWFALGVASYLGAVVAAYVSNVPWAGFLVLPLVVGSCYSLGRLKRLLLVKNLLVGLSWGAIPLGVGVYFDVLRSTEILFLFGYVTAMLTIAAIVFDIKDIEGDRAAGIVTVPSKFGTRVTRITSMAATVVVAGVLGIVVLFGPLPTEYLVLLVLNAYVLGYSCAANPQYGPMYYGFVIDGEHLFLSVVVLGVDSLVW